MFLKCRDTSLMHDQSSFRPGGIMQYKLGSHKKTVRLEVGHLQIESVILICAGNS